MRPAPSRTTSRNASGKQAKTRHSGARSSPRENYSPSRSRTPSPSCASWKKHASNCSTSYPISLIPAPPSVKTQTTTYRSGTGARKSAFDFQPLDHYALIQKLDVVDIERAVKIAGARTYALKADAPRTELASLNFSMELTTPPPFT